MTVARLAQLWVGLCCYGLSMALMVRARLGLDPWDTFHQGISRHSGASFGTVVILTGAAVLLSWIPLRQRPGLGTVSNVILIGVSVDGFLAVLPAPSLVAVRAAFMLTGVVLCGVATGMYISVGMGPGPRDGLMTGIAARTGWSIRLTRTALELCVLLVGWLLGGTVGVGTVAFALCIGPATQLSLGLFGRLPTVTARPAGLRAAPAITSVDGVGTL
jgi:uncharacterized membrane protein YczE